MTGLDWAADLGRIGETHSFFHKHLLWAIRIYHFGRSIGRHQPGTAKAFLLKIYWELFRFVETLTGISLRKNATSGSGIRIWHFGGLFINPETRVGAGCTLRQGVTLGNLEPGGPCPTLGDNVELSSYAQVLGSVTTGDNCRIGALSVVLRDFPAGASAVGNPARIITISLP